MWFCFRGANFESLARYHSIWICLRWRELISILTLTWLSYVEIIASENCWMVVESGDLFCEKKSKASFAPALMRKIDFDSKADTLAAPILVDIWSLRSEKYSICCVMLIVDPWCKCHSEFLALIFTFQILILIPSTVYWCTSNLNWKGVKNVFDVINVLHQI